MLNAKRYRALKYRGPGTDLTLGLPDGHIWMSGQSTSRTGIRFAPNLPTEEVFTIADRTGVDGTVRAYRCILCGKARELAAVASAKLRALGGR